MTTRKLMTVLAAPVLLLSAYFYTQRLQIEARIWHLRYGNWLHISDYDVPVSGEWLVMRSTDEDPIVLVDTQQKRDRRMSDVNTIVIEFHRRSPVSLETWQSITEDGLRENGKLTVEEKRLQTDAQTAVCLTGHEFRDVMHIAGMNMVTADCMSSTGFHLTLVGDNTGLEKLYGIISGIRKRG